jgi:hypothetical protein
MPRPLRSTLLILAGRAGCLLHRGLETLLREVLLERTQRLVGGAAHGADQRGAVPQQGVRVLAREALLQLDDRRRVGEAEQLLRDPQIVQVDRPLPKPRSGSETSGGSSA